VMTAPAQEGLASERAFAGLDEHGASSKLHGSAGAFMPVSVAHYFEQSVDLVPDRR
jgi:hypothetical protein